MGNFWKYRKISEKIVINFINHSTCHLRMVDESVRLRQGAVQKTGDIWEEEVIDILSSKLNKFGIRIVKGRKKISKRNFGLNYTYRQKEKVFGEMWI